MAPRSLEELPSGGGIRLLLCGGCGYFFPFLLFTHVSIYHSINGCSGLNSVNKEMTKTASILTEFRLNPIK